MPPITDTSLCPSCGFPGTPETFDNGVLRMICKHHEVCDYEDYWDHLETPMPLKTTTDLYAEVQPNPLALRSLHEGKKIQFIKEVRAQTGCGLKEAKYFADDIMERALRTDCSVCGKSAGVYCSRPIGYFRGGFCPDRVYPFFLGFLDLVALFEEADLDELVIELKCSEASNINNEGVEGQLRYCVEQLGREGVLKEMDRPDPRAVTPAPNDLTTD
jgi:hypothetical protein